MVVVSDLQIHSIVIKAAICDLQIHSMVIKATVCDLQIHIMMIKAVIALASSQRPTGTAALLWSKADL